jgi:cytochrome c oxidase subunit 2
MTMARIRKLVPVLGFLAVGLLAAGSASAEDNARGEALFGLCTQCHGQSGEGNPDIEAPAIAGLSEWYVLAQLEKFRSGARGAHPDDYAGLRMRPMARVLRGEDDVKAVAAYVGTLPVTTPEQTLEGGDAARGEELYKPCIACHGMEGEGNVHLNGPRLTGASDWYLQAQLRKYKAGVRGGNKLDTTGMLMRPMAAVLTHEQQVKYVIAYLMTLSK